MTSDGRPGSVVRIDLDGKDPSTRQSLAPAFLASLRDLIGWSPTTSARGVPQFSGKLLPTGIESLRGHVSSQRPALADAIVQAFRDRERTVEQLRERDAEADTARQQERVRHLEITLTICGANLIAARDDRALLVGEDLAGDLCDG